MYKFVSLQSYHFSFPDHCSFIHLWIFVFYGFFLIATEDHSIHDKCEILVYAIICTRFAKRSNTYNYMHIQDHIECINYLLCKIRIVSRFCTFQIIWQFRFKNDMLLAPYTFTKYICENLTTQVTISFSSTDLCDMHLILNTSATVHKICQKIST